MKRLLVTILVFGAALCFGGYVAQAEEQHFMADGEQKILEIKAKAAIIEAEGYVNRVRPFWSEDESFPRTPVPAPLSVASSPQPRPRATVAPVASSPVLPVPTARLEQSKPPVAIVPPAAKPPVVAASVEKPKPKAVEQAKVQASAKPQDNVKVCAMKIPLEEDTQIKGVLYKKGQPLWALIREKDGRVVDKNGRPTSEPELVSAPPRGAILVPFKAPQI